jgi:hypothetical protein
MAPDSKLALVVFFGGLGDSSVERLVGGARWAATRDSIDAALESGHYGRVVLVTDDDGVVAESPGVTIDLDDGDFHFGRRLAGVIRRYELDRIVYMGGGSIPLFGAADFAGIGKVLAGGGTALTNNRYSSDVIGWTSTVDTLRLVEQVDRDNALAPLLAEKAGLDVQELPRTAQSLFDIDAPTDVLVLKLSGVGGLHLREYTNSVDVDISAYERTLPLFLNRENQIIVAGRVGSHTWRYLETETACRVRLFAEERGMEADGRAAAGTARSLLGYYLDSVGVERAVETLAKLGDAAFIDTRVLAAHAGARPSREDRFLSDLGRWEEIEDPFLRELTKGAAAATIPVLLGGHSLMSGALMLLNETAWRLRDEGRL